MKIFANEDFGYRRITVERPLRLRWEVDGGHGRRYSRGTKQWAKLPGGQQQDSPVCTALVGHRRRREAPNSPKRLGAVPKGIEKPIWDALAVA